MNREVIVTLMGWWGAQNRGAFEMLGARRCELKNGVCTVPVMPDRQVREIRIELLPESVPEGTE